jgi:hypothetical protein
MTPLVEQLDARAAQHDSGFAGDDPGPVKVITACEGFLIYEIEIGGKR